MEEGSAVPAIFDDKKDILLSEEDNDSLLQHSSVKLANGWKLRIPKGMPLWLEQPNFNTFIFCVSQEDNPTKDKAKRLGYDSFYKITHPFNFGQAVMWSLMKHIKSKHGITGKMGPVNYVPKKIHIVNREQPSPPPKSFSTIELYTKHDRFKEDKEFRYVFLEFSNPSKTQYNTFKADGFVIENKEISKWVEIA